MATPRRPTPGVDYPRTAKEFEARFPTEEACRGFLVRLRWPDGYDCPSCGHTEPPWITARGYLHCRDCQGEISPTAGTLFERSRTPLRVWFQALWRLADPAGGPNARALQRTLGLGSYQTAWAWMHKLRRAMAPAVDDRLTGSIEVGEIILGFEDDTFSPSHVEQRPLVLVAAERRSGRIGRIRLRHVPDLSRKRLLGFVLETVVPGSLVNTNGAQNYRRIWRHGYRDRIWRPRNPKPQPVLPAIPEPMPRVDQISRLLKQWLTDTHHEGIQRRHLQAYLDEFAFRFNHRWPRSRGLMFHRLAQLAADVTPTPFRDVVAGTDGPRGTGADHLPRVNTRGSRIRAMWTFLRSRLRPMRQFRAFVSIRKRRF